MVDTDIPEGLDEFLNASPIPSTSQVSNTVSPPSDPSDPSEPEGLNDFIAPEMQAEKYGTPMQQMATIAEGASQALAGPVIPYIETKLGVPPEDIRLRAQTNPWEHGIAEAGTFAASMLVGYGEAALLAKAGAGAKILTGLGKGSTLAAKLGGSAVQMGTEMALLQAGDEMTKAITEVPQTFGSIASNVGLSAILGMAAGPVFKGIGLAAGAAADKVGLGQFIEDFKGRLGLNMSGTNAPDKVFDELNQHYTNVKGAADDVFGANGLKEQAIQKLAPVEFSDKIVNQVKNIDADVKASLGEMAGNPDLYPPRLAKSFERDLNIYNASVNQAENPAQAYQAMNELKQRMQGYYPKGRILNRVDPEFDFIKSTEAVRNSLKTGLEDSAVWGDAAKVQGSINKAFSKYLPTLKDFESKFTSKINGIPEVDPAKVGTYLNQSGKATSTTVRQKMLGNFLDASEKYQREIESIHSDAGLESPLTQSSLAATKDTLSQLPAGAKAADIYYKRAISDALGETAGAVAGGGVGHMTGLPGAGTAGAWAGSRIGKSVLPSIIQPLLEKAGNSAGFKAAAHFGSNVVNGESNLINISKKLFKSGETVPQHLMPNSEKVQKLDKHLKSAQADPTQMFNIAGDLGHYMPDHAQAYAQGAMNAVNTLNQSRPQSVKAAPLDPDIPPSKDQELQFKRHLEIAEQPLVTFHHMKQGTLLPQDVSTLQKLYPAYYQRMSQAVMSAMTAHLAEGNTIPSRLRQSMSLFLGQPMDSTLTPQSIAATQQLYAANNQAQQTPQSPQGGKQKRGSPSKLSTHIASNMQTPAQAREQRGNKV